MSMFVARGQLCCVIAFIFSYTSVKLIESYTAAAEEHKYNESLVTFAANNAAPCIRVPSALLD